MSSVISQQSLINSAKIPCAYKYSGKKFEFSLHNAEVFFNENKDGENNKMQTGFEKFLTCLDSYLDLLDDHTINITGDTRIKIYGSVTLENGNKVRATSSFHDRAWFSNIAISMDSEESNDYLSDQGLCYGQVIQF